MHQVFVPVMHQAGAQVRAAPALPDNGIVQRLPGLPVKYDEGLALVGNAERQQMHRVCGVALH